MAETAVINVGDKFIWREAQIANEMLPQEASIRNKLRTLNERHIRIRKTYQSPGQARNSSY